MAGIRAKLRSDLELRCESEAADSSLIVKDPLTRRFYRFPSVQAAVLRRLDGTQEPEMIAGAVTEECKISVLASQVEEFARNLQKLLLLDHPAVWARLEAKDKSQNRILRSLLSIKIHAFNPDDLLTRLDKHLDFLFRPAFHAFVWCVIAGAAIIAVLNREALFLTMRSLFSLYSLPLVFLIAFLVMTIHEFAHGLALKHFGGRVQEMGLLILYFMPAFYCNVDDAWFMSRRHRLLVTLAGGYVQLFICALATIAWRFLTTEIAASRFLVAIIAFSAAQTLFNFNPLIRLDGYYLLGDIMRLPNLRPRAFKFIRRKLSGWLWGSETLSDRLSKREEWIYASYGMASMLFTAGVLCLVLQQLGGWMLREFRMWGLLAAAALVLMSLPSVREMPIVEKSKEPSGMAVSRKKSIRLLVLAAALLLISFLPWELKVAGDFVILPSQKVSITPEVGGILKTINVDEGQAVRKGDILAQVENLDLANSYHEARGELASRRAGLDLLNAGNRPEEIEKARRQIATKQAELLSANKVQQERAVLLDTVAKREVELDNAARNFERNRQLFSQGLVARADLERAQTAYEVQQRELGEARGQLKVLEERTDRLSQVKQKELEQAGSDLEVLLAGSRKEAILAAKAEVKKMEEKIAILLRQLEQLKIRSPMDGIVATPYLRNLIGKYLQKGDNFCEIVSSGMVIVDLPVPEKEIADVRIGSPITLKVRGYPTRSLEARVRSISPVAVEKGTERMVVVLGELDNADGTLKAGMSGVGKILCGKRLIIDLVTRRAIRWLRTEFWEYLP